MAEQSTAQLMQQLGCDDRHLGFMEYLPEAVQKEIATGIEQQLDERQQQLTRAIDDGTRAMPGWLGFFANFLLK